MKQRTAIFLALVLTAFAVVLVAAVTFTIFAQTTTSQTEALKPALVEKTEGGLGEQISFPSILPTNTPRPTQTVSATSQPKMVSAERASRLALAQFANSKLMSSPELVNYKGRMAYEVVLSGGLVYVDAFSGKILASILTVAANPTPTQESADTGSWDNGGNSNDGGNEAENIPAVSATDVPPPPPTDTPSQHHDDDDDRDDDGDDDRDDHPGDDDNQKKDDNQNHKKDKQDKQDKQDHKDHDDDDGDEGHDDGQD